jgi:hypothetical protein
VISFAIRAASAVEEQLKEKSRLCQLVNDVSDKFKVFSFNTIPSIFLFITV